MEEDTRNVHLVSWGFVTLLYSDLFRGYSISLKVCQCKKPATSSNVEGNERTTSKVYITLTLPCLYEGTSFPWSLRILSALVQNLVSRIPLYTTLQTEVLFFKGRR